MELRPEQAPMPITDARRDRIALAVLRAGKEHKIQVEARAAPIE